MKYLFKRFFILLVLSAIIFTPVQYAFAGAKSSVKRASDTVLHIKFAETDEVNLESNHFVSSRGNDLSTINATLTGKTASKSKLFKSDKKDLKTEREALKNKFSNKYVPILNNYYRLVLNQDQDINKVINDLKQLPYISEAYAEPLPAESPVSPSYANLQTHFGSAPQGMGIEAASQLPGALGDRVQIADLEYSWNTSHEDISDASQTGAVINNGTPSDPFNDNNHGTAVTGLLNGDRNSYGINGIVSNSKLYMVNTLNTERGWDIPNAIYTAKSSLTAGDVMLIEQQTWGPEGHGYVPVEWVPAVYDAIKITTLSGINVVEAAANGGENLDDPIYGSTFPLGKEDSGAIIVGAGSACNGTSNHARLSFSNYGSRVNVQGYGECVTTAGYGHLNGSESANAWYTSYFNGTSSASALVAAVVGSVSSSYEYQKNVVLTPLQIRNLLISTGSPQDKTIDSGNIGPLPNLEAAIRSFTSAADTSAPTAPTRLSAAYSKQRIINLKWRASTDNSGTIVYRVYRNGFLIAITSNVNFSDSLITPKTKYSYKIQAVDPSGNTSAFSNTVYITSR